MNMLSKDLIFVMFILTFDSKPSMATFFQTGFSITNSASVATFLKKNTCSFPERSLQLCNLHPERVLNGEMCALLFQIECWGEKLLVALPQDGVLLAEVARLLLGLDQALPQAAQAAHVLPDEKFSWCPPIKKFHYLKCNQNISSVQTVTHLIVPFFLTQT